MQRPPSLDVVEDTLRHEFDAHARRVEAADARAGLLLGIAGLLVSLGADGGWPPLALLARVLAAAAALVALVALGDTAQAEPYVDPARAAGYLQEDPARLRLRLLETRVTMFRVARRRHRRKLARLRLATGLVTLAVALTVAGATVEAVR